jgi:hypothetical protein
MQYTLETYMYSQYNIQIKHLQYASEIIEIFGTYIYNICLKQLKHVEHTLATYATPDLLLQHPDETHETYI